MGNDLSSTKQGKREARDGTSNPLAQILKTTRRISDSGASA